MVQREGTEVAEDEGEDGWRGEEVGEAAVAAVVEGRDGVGEIGELGRWESGEGCHYYGFSGGLVCHHMIMCKIIMGVIYETK